MPPLSSKEEAPDTHRGAGDTGEHAKDGEENLARQEIQGTEHEAEFQESFADIEAQCTTLLDLGFLILGDGILLDFLGIAGVFAPGSLQLLYRSLGLGPIRTQFLHYPPAHFAGIFSN